jgi:hypothetical protein
MVCDAELGRSDFNRGGEDLENREQLLSGFFPPERFVFGTQELSKRTFLSTPSVETADFMLLDELGCLFSHVSP